jgi:hypothetical protein
MNIRTPFAGALLTLTCAIASAQAPAASAATPRIDARQARQEQRIEQGQSSGALTPHETRRLEREQKGIAHAETKAKADGTVTPQERRRLTRLQNSASRDIHHQKHDAQTAATPTNK